MTNTPQIYLYLPSLYDFSGQGKASRLLLEDINRQYKNLASIHIFSVTSSGSPVFLRLISHLRLYFSAFLTGLYSGLVNPRNTCFVSACLFSPFYFVKLFPLSVKHYGILHDVFFLYESNISRLFSCGLLSFLRAIYFTIFVSYSHRNQTYLYSPSFSVARDLKEFGHYELANSLSIHPFDTTFLDSESLPIINRNSIPQSRSCSHYRDLGDFGIFLYSLPHYQKSPQDAFHFIVNLSRFISQFCPTNFVVHIYMFERFYLSLPCESSEAIHSLSNIDLIRVGHISNDRFLELLKTNINMLVSTSLHESYFFPFHEALASECSILMPYSHAFSAYIQNKNTYFSLTSNPRDFIRAFMYCILDAYPCIVNDSSQLYDLFSDDIDFISLSSAMTSAIWSDLT